MSVLTALKMAPWVGILLLLGIVSVQGSRIHRFHEQAIHCVQARVADRASYETAQKAAKAQNDAEVASKEAESREITKETRDAYQNDLAKLRADSDRRVQQARAAAAASAAGKSGSPESPKPSAGADGDGLHLSADEHLQAEEVELRLMHLQNWVRDQINAQ